METINLEKLAWRYAAQRGCGIELARAHVKIQALRLKLDGMPAERVADVLGRLFV